MSVTVSTSAHTRISLLPGQILPVMLYSPAHSKDDLYLSMRMSMKSLIESTSLGISVDQIQRDVVRFIFKGLKTPNVFSIVYRGGRCFLVNTVAAKGSNFKLRINETEYVFKKSHLSVGEFERGENRLLLRYKTLENSLYVTVRDTLGDMAEGRGERRMGDFEAFEAFAMHKSVYNVKELYLLFSRVGYMNAEYIRESREDMKHLPFWATRVVLLHFIKKANDALLQRFDDRSFDAAVCLFLAGETAGRGGAGRELPGLLEFFFQQRLFLYQKTLKLHFFAMFNEELQHLTGLVARALCPEGQGGFPVAVMERVVLGYVLESFAQRSGLAEHEFFRENNVLFVAELTRALFNFGYGNISLNCFKELETRFSGSFNLSDIQNSVDRLIEIVCPAILRDVGRLFRALEGALGSLSEHQLALLREMHKGKQSVIKSGKKIGFVEHCFGKREAAELGPDKKVQEYASYVRIVRGGRDEEASLAETLQSVYEASERLENFQSKRLRGDLLRYFTSFGIPCLGSRMDGEFILRRLAETGNQDIRGVRLPHVRYNTLCLIAFSMCIIRRDKIDATEIYAIVARGQRIRVSTKKLNEHFGMSFTSTFAKRFLLKTYISYNSQYVLKPLVQQRNVSREELQEVCRIPVFKNLPEWWEIGKHDEWLLRGAFKYGLNDWESLLETKEMGWPDFRKNRRPRIEVMSKRHKKLVFHVLKHYGVSPVAPTIECDLGVGREGTE